MLALQANDIKLDEERKLFSTLVDLLSYEKMLFTGKSEWILFFYRKNIV